MQGPVSAMTPCGSLGMGLLLLYISILTTTAPHRCLSYFRLALAPPAILYFWDFGYGPYETPIRRIVPGMATIGIYSIMRVIEHSIIGFWDPSPPHWVLHMNGTHIIVPPPNTFWGRCSYALDLLTSLRGSSWFVDMEWNWNPRSLQSSTPPPSRWQFIVYNIRTFLIQYLLFDLCDTLNKSQNWETKAHNPITSLSMMRQFVFSISVCAGIGLSISMPYKLISCIFVLCGSSPGSWPPMFHSPFYSKSLRDFWSRRWHFMFRRVFERLSYPLTYLWSSNFRGEVFQSRRTLSLIRSTLAFAFSTLLHLIIMHRLALRECKDGTPCPPFLDMSILNFFLAQPLGLLAESALVVPFAAWVFPPYHRNQMQEKNGHAGPPSEPFPAVRGSNGEPPCSRWEWDVVTRVYAWGFLIWTGRWWSDQWVRMGLLDEPVIPFSFLRGVLRGEWIV